MLQRDAGRLTEAFQDEYVVFDLETTGVSTTNDRIIEISGIRVRNGEVEEEFASLVNPECRIPAQASRINGITDDMVAGKPTIRTVLERFLDFAGDRQLVGHNIHTFDMRFIHRDARDAWGMVPGNDYLDTLILARSRLPELRQYRLVDLAEYYGLDTKGAHRALADCRMNQVVYEKLKKEKVQESAAPRCPRCGNVLVRRKGRFGEFWGCTRFPYCRYTRDA